jgi:urease accessory protein
MGIFMLGVWMSLLISETTTMKTIARPHFMKSTAAWVPAMIVFLPAIAMAHPGHHADGGMLPSLASGFLHPLSGMDHIILALAMGWLALSLGAHRAKAPALAFLAALVTGALCGRWISGGTGLEIAISLSVLAAGGAMLRGRLRGLGMLSIVAVAGGLVHGLAHGAEALPGVSFATYAAGLLVSTALLLGAGGLVQHAFSRAGHPQVAIRAAGLFMIGAGITSLIGIF